MMEQEENGGKASTSTETSPSRDEPREVFEELEVSEEALEAAILEYEKRYNSMRTSPEDIFLRFATVDERSAKRRAQQHKAVDRRAAEYDLRHRKMRWKDFIASRLHSNLAVGSKRSDDASIRVTQRGAVVSDG